MTIINKIEESLASEIKRNEVLKKTLDDLKESHIRLEVKRKELEVEKAKEIALKKEVDQKTSELMRIFSQKCVQEPVPFMPKQEPVEESKSIVKVEQKPTKTPSNDGKAKSVSSDLKEPHFSQKFVQEPVPFVPKQEPFEESKSIVKIEQKPTKTPSDDGKAKSVSSDLKEPHFSQKFFQEPVPFVLKQEPVEEPKSIDKIEQKPTKTPSDDGKA